MRKAGVNLSLVCPALDTAAAHRSLFYQTITTGPEDQSLITIILINQVPVIDQIITLRVCVCVGQVEQLFRLGLRSRPECVEVLQRCSWNLEHASTQMLDSYGASRQRY